MENVPSFWLTPSINLAPYVLGEPRGGPLRSSGGPSRPGGPMHVRHVRNG